ncbi:ATP binding protein [Reticulomyxa filosa]|uniref:Kinesin-like protein n=1 Tax=Reticulomyxa filosa TaxID=46433 RepID=X6NXY0_RETFI|nr:ATP binding protein [Reticulomyxa filosa]|eukprot:ETO30684.1 ATP binding protein [Reticulomyxa filosa]
MEGGDSIEDAGVIYRSVDELFRLKKEKLEQHELLHGNNHTRRKSADEANINDPEKIGIRIWLSCLEVYNETIRDLMFIFNDLLLLLLLLLKYNNKNDNDNIHKNGKVTVPGLTQTEVYNTEEVRQLLKNVASKNRASGVTNMNAHSSRSHWYANVISIDVWVETRRQILVELSDDDKEDIAIDGGDGNMREEEEDWMVVRHCQSRLVLIDLAGSERVKRSGVTGKAMDEAKSINQSLAALGNVMAALQSKQKHVPFRDSTLTYLLHDCLGGDSKALMFCNISCESLDVKESLNTLQFATRVRSIELGEAKKYSGIGDDDDDDDDANGNDYNQAQQLKREIENKNTEITAIKTLLQKTKKNKDKDKENELTDNIANHENTGILVNNHNLVDTKKSIPVTKENQVLENKPKFQIQELKTKIASLKSLFILALLKTAREDQSKTPTSFQSEMKEKSKSKDTQNQENNNLNIMSQIKSDDINDKKVDFDYQSKKLGQKRKWPSTDETTGEFHDEENNSADHSNKKRRTNEFTCSLMPSTIFDSLHLKLILVFFDIAKKDVNPRTTVSTCKVATVDSIMKAIQSGTYVENVIAKNLCCCDFADTKTIIASPKAEQPEQANGNTNKNKMLPVTGFLLWVQFNHLFKQLFQTNRQNKSKTFTTRLIFTQKRKKKFVE